MDKIKDIIKTYIVIPFVFIKEIIKKISFYYSDIYISWNNKGNNIKGHILASLFLIVLFFIFPLIIFVSLLYSLYEILKGKK